MYQASAGSLDAKVEQAWEASLETPTHPRFQWAAQTVATFYQSQGYDLKAERIFRQAIAALPADASPELRRGMMLQLAQHFEGTQQLVKALEIREEMAKNRPAGNSALLNSEMTGLASLYELMGEMGKAGALWKEIAASRATDDQQNPPSSAPNRIANPMVSLSLAPSSLIMPRHHDARPSALADFYARQGRTAEADQLYKKALADAATSASPGEWDDVANSYKSFLTQQGQLDEAADLIRQSIARLESSPDANSASNLVYRRQELARMLTQAGHRDDALAVQKQAVEAAATRGQGSPGYAQALSSLADLLITQNRLTEAEKVVAQLRSAGASDARSADFRETMAVQTLARIRDMQKRPEEARRLRASVRAPGEADTNRAVTLFDLASPAQQAAYRGNTDAAVAAIDKVLALADERIPANPNEVTALVNLAGAFRSRQKEAEAKSIVAEAYRLLEEARDHPRVADALSSLVPMMHQLGMTAETEQAIERQEKIILAAKGPESLGLDLVSAERINLRQRNSDWAGAIDEHKRVLARTEMVTGPKSRESLYALRKLAWAYSPMNNWPEEQQIFGRLQERTADLFGKSSLEYAQVLESMANRARQNRQFDQALGWMDEAIEITRSLPNAATVLQNMTRKRARIVDAKDAPSGRPSSGSSPWFNSDRFNRTDGVRLGGDAAQVVIENRPAVIRRAAPNAAVAAPAQAPPSTPTQP